MFLIFAPNQTLNTMNAKNLHNLKQAPVVGLLTNNKMKNIFIFFLCTIVAGCSSLTKLYNSGQYDEVIHRTMKRLEHDPSKEKYIKYLEAAYDKEYYRDMDHITFLQKEGNPANDLAIYQGFQAIRNRHEMVKPLLPLVYPSKHRNAEFKDVSDEDLIAAKNTAADYLYADAQKLMKNKNISDARKAYDELNIIKGFFNNYKDVDAQINKAHALGMTNVIFRMANGSAQILPANFENQLDQIDIGQLNTLWLNYMNHIDTSLYYQYGIVTNLKFIDVSPEMVSPNIYTDSKTIPDGFEYQLDLHGNVMKDSLGNDIKKPKFKTITCTVTETVQKKSATISGTVDYYDNRTGTLIKSIPVQADAQFLHTYAVANGDMNALTDASKEKIKSLPVPFPPTMDMLTQCGEHLKPLVKQAIWDNKYLIAN
ncbi:MAG: hypothetical protein D4R43_04085 [Sphingobacteriales bacterium]|nr:MAG: hypothetical protein D4R43_04085 [Sphingobacteriales bacterium]